MEGLKPNLPLFILLVPNYNWLNYAVNNFFSTHKGGILNITEDCDNNESLSCTGRSECKSRTFIPAAGTRVPPPNKHHPGGSSGTWQRLGMTSPDHNSIEQSARVTNGQREHVSAFHNQSINCPIVSQATTRQELTAANLCPHRVVDPTRPTINDYAQIDLDFILSTFMLGISIIMRGRGINLKHWGKFLFSTRVDLTTVSIYKNSWRYQKSGTHRN